MISVSVRETKPKFFGKLEQAMKDIDKFLFKLASQVRNDIVERTLSGKDVKLTGFKPYAESTKISRQARGRPTDKVNLSMFNEMLNSMSTIKTNNGAKIYFTSKAEENKASWHNEGVPEHTIPVKNKKVLADKKAGLFFGKEVTVSLPKREFFGLSKKDIDYIDQQIERALYDK